MNFFSERNHELSRGSLINDNSDEMRRMLPVTLTYVYDTGWHMYMHAHYTELFGKNEFWKQEQQIM